MRVYKFNMLDALIFLSRLRVFSTSSVAELSSVKEFQMFCKSFKNSKMDDTLL